MIDPDITSKFIAWGEISFNHLLYSIQFKEYLLFRTKTSKHKKYNYQFIKSWDKTKEPAEASLWDAGPVNCNPDVETGIQINEL